MAELDKEGGMLRPFVWLGVNFDGYTGNQAHGDCPLCGREGKFYVNMETSQWDCKKCGDRGNVYSFMQKLWESSPAADEDLTKLAKSRRLLNYRTLKRWGVVRSCITGEWLLPAFNAKGSVAQIYKYVNDKSSGKYKLWATPKTRVPNDGEDVPTEDEITHQLFGVQNYDPKRPVVFLFEGPWDAMCFEETGRRAKRTEDGDLAPTTNAASSILADANVLATPGASVFKKAWLPLFAGKTVILMYDNDHPRTHPQTGSEIEPAGYAGMRRAAEAMIVSDQPPKEVKYLRWGDGTTKHDADLPTGYDVRDYLTQGDDQGDNERNRIEKRIEAMALLWSKIVPIPEEWIKGRSKDAKASGGSEIEPIACAEWRVLVNAWKSTMKWTEGLNKSLATMLAVITSTNLIGDQLWCKIVGPPGCGKSVLCEAVSINRRYVKAVSTFRGFHSGYKTDKDGTEDNSLIPQIKGKTMVMKDGDTLLQAPNLSQILAEARDLYDSVSRTSYRNTVNRDYEGVRMTWLLCGTGGLRRLDSSELGERFVECRVVEHMDDETLQEIMSRHKASLRRSAGMEANGKAEEHFDPKRLKAMRLTGGYIDYLRTNAGSLVKAIDQATPDSAFDRCQHLAELVSYLRSRPSKVQDEVTEKEMPTRLLSQFVRLAQCLAAVFNRKAIDDYVLYYVTRVALDTSHGLPFDIVRALRPEGDDGLEPSGIAVRVNKATDAVKKALHHMSAIGAVEPFVFKRFEGMPGRQRWRLSPKLKRLYDGILGGLRVDAEEATEGPSSVAASEG